MKDYSLTFNQKLEEILIILKRTDKDNLIARVTFNIIMKYINEKDNTNEVIEAITNLEKVLNELSLLSYEFEFKEVIKSNIKDLIKIKNKIKSNDEEDYTFIWWILAVIVFFILMAGK